MRAIAVLEPGRLGVVELPEPEPGPYEAVVKTEAAFLCNATDRKIIDGHLPGLGPEQYPLILGHESVGRVVKTGTKVSSFRTGDRVVGGLLIEVPGGEFKSGFGGHAEYIVVHDDEAMRRDGVADEAHGWNEVFRVMKKVPDDLPLPAAGLLNTWREAYSGMFDDFGLTANDEIIIFGGGPVGLSMVRFASLRGFPLIACVDPNPPRRKKAESLGAHRTYALDDPALAGLKFDAVIDAVGRESVINAGLSLVRMGGSVCVYGVLGEPVVGLRRTAAPYNFKLLFHQWPTRVPEAACQDQLVAWIRDNSLNWRDFVSAVFDFKDIASAIEESRKKTSTKIMLRFGK